MRVDISLVEIDRFFSQLAMNPTKLKKLGFTHILNAAEGRKFGQINTCATFYEEASIEYLGFPILDTPRYQINKHFSRTIEFLSKALEEKKSWSRKTIRTFSRNFLFLSDFQVEFMFIVNRFRINESFARILMFDFQGISRSATLVLAFLLQTEEKLSLLDVVQLVSSRRPIRPNDGFCRELIRFEREIRTTNNSDRPSNETEIEWKELDE